METATVTRRAAAQLAPVAQPALPAAIYCRISNDSEGRELGVSRQEADCRALAERLGLEVVQVYIENDVSASTSSRKARPQYDEMLRAVRARQIEVIVAYSLSRLTRRVREFLDLIDLYKQTGVSIRTCVSGEPDLSTADGRGMAVNLANWDQMETERTAERAQRAKAQAAAQGRYRGGKRPYGFDANGVTIREHEAEVIREATTAVLAGRSLRAVARELNAGGRQAVRDRKVKGAAPDAPREEYTVSWTYGRLRDVLIRPRNAGLLHTGRVDRGRPTSLTRAVWQPIVTEDEWRAVYDLLTDPARRSSGSGEKEPRLGSNLYRCGRCGATMRPAVIGGTPSRQGSKRTHVYRCSEVEHLGIMSAPTDEFVLGVVADLVRDDRVRAAMQVGDDGAVVIDRERRTVLMTRLESFQNDYAQGVITGLDLARARTVVENELAEVDARMTEALRRLTSSPVLGSLDPGQAFLDAPVDVQRAVLVAVLRVEVLPATRRGAAWSSDRLRLTPVAADVAAGPMTTSPPGGSGPEPVLRAPTQGLDPDYRGVETHEQDNDPGRRPDQRQ